MYNKAKSTEKIQTRYDLRGKGQIRQILRYDLSRDWQKHIEHGKKRASGPTNSP